MTLSFQTRLVLFCTGTFALIIVVLSFVSYRLLARQLDLDASADLAELTNGLHGYLRFDEGVPSLTSTGSDADEASFLHDATEYYQVYDADNGRLLVQSDGLDPLGVHYTPDEVRAFVDGPAPFDLQTPYGRFRFSNSVISPPAGGRYLVQVGTSLAPMDAALARYLGLLVSRMLPLAILALVGVWWMARTAVAPLRELAADARRVSIRTLDHRLQIRGSGDELDEVGTAFNETLARLERAVGDMKQFASALAHELRTPLAALRGELELTLITPMSECDWRANAASQVEEIDKLTRLVNQLLTLARAEAGEIQLARAPVALGALVTATADQVEPIALAKGLQLECRVDAGATVTGDREWLERLVLNLLDNAVKYTPPEGAVCVAVASTDDGGVRLEVCDTGVGIPADVLPRVFDRFFRGDPARSSSMEGAGLGLTLVKWIVDRHAGRIDVRSEPGRGSTFTVWLPGAPPPPAVRHMKHS
jgi:heavy metal sensor kinase